MPFLFFVDGTRKMTTNLTAGEQAQVAEILNRRANEVAGFSDDYTKDPKYYGSVQLALQREIERLRRLADKVCPSVEDDS